MAEDYTWLIRDLPNREIIKDLIDGTRRARRHLAGGPRISRMGVANWCRYLEQLARERPTLVPGLVRRAVALYTRLRDV